MINVNALKAEWVKNGMTQEEVARIINVSPKTFSLKLKKGILKSDEIEKLIVELKITNPMEIFFDK